jgi:hypothetical protein
VFVTVLAQVDSEPKNSRVRVTVDVTGVLARHNVCWVPDSRGTAEAVALGDVRIYFCFLEWEKVPKCNEHKALEGCKEFHFLGY